MAKCSSCETYKRRLRGWNITFQELPLIHFQNLHPEKIWSAPILEIGDKIYEYESIRESRDKLWKAIEPHRNTGIDKKKTTAQTGRTQEELRKEVNKTNFKRTKKNKKTTPTITIKEEIDEIVTKQMKFWLTCQSMSDDIENTFNRVMTKQEQIAFLLGFRLARHSEAVAWENKAIEALDRARMLDPYRKIQGDHNNELTGKNTHTKVKWPTKKKIDPRTS